MAASVGECRSSVSRTNVVDVRDILFLLWPVMNQMIQVLALQLGIKPVTVRRWRDRGHVPHKWRIPLIKAAQQCRVVLDERDFEFPVRARAEATSVNSAAASNRSKSNCG